MKKTSKATKKTTKSGNSFLTGRFSFSRNQVILLIALLVAIGGYIIYRSHAATSTIVGPSDLNTAQSVGASKTTDTVSKQSTDVVALASGSGNKAVFISTINPLDAGVYKVCLNGRVATDGGAGGDFTATGYNNGPTGTASTTQYIQAKTDGFVEIKCITNLTFNSSQPGIQLTVTNTGGQPLNISGFSVNKTGDIGGTGANFNNPCVGSTSPGGYDHVIWITFENQSYQHVIGNTSTQPYINTLAKQCGLATKFYPELHPSLPNYIAMTSGSTQGITGDSSGQLNVDNIYNQVKNAGKTWKQYSFTMPSNCYKSDAPPSPNAGYTAHHEAVIFYSDLNTDCPNRDVPVNPVPSNPYPSVPLAVQYVDNPNDVNSSPLQADIDNNTLPNLAIIGPSDDGGNSSQGGEVDPKLGDPFLKRWMQKIMNSPIYASGKTAIFVTWDEGDDFSAQPPNLQNIATLVIAPSVPANTSSATVFNHYSMLRSTEEMLGISNYLGNAASATSMRSAFNL